MKIKKLIIIIPQFCPAGPIRGAIAISNGLSKYFEITLVALKGVRIDRDKLGLAPEIKLLDYSHLNWFKKYSSLKKLIKLDAVFFSICFSADFINSLLPRNVKKMTSIRGNLFQNYSHDYGFIKGRALACFHYLICYRLNLVIAMSDFMKNDLRKWKYKWVETVYNFVDENFLKKEFNCELKKSYDIVFIGNLNSRKKPMLLLEVCKNIIRNGRNISVCLIGDGALKSEIEKYIQNKSISKNVTLTGHVDNPYKEIQKANICVLPSLSEGVSRSILESLYFGLPCILRNTEAACEIITDLKNGLLFNHDEDLEKSIITLLDKPELFSKESIIPNNFKMEYNIKKLQGIIQQLGQS